MRRKGGWHPENTRKTEEYEEVKRKTLQREDATWGGLERDSWRISNLLRRTTGAGWVLEARSLAPKSCGLGGTWQKL